MSVIGFDIGNESCVIAVAKRGGVDVLLNNESKRETPAVVSFGEEQRFLGSAGAAFATANPKSTVSQIKRLIGRLYKEVEEDLKLLPFATREGPRGGILIELEYLKTKRTFTPVEILAMLLKHLKQLTEKNLETSVVDCVIGIPSYYTDLQRRLYLDAAFLAGLKPLRLLHDGTAIALGYGMYKTDFSESRRTIVMFVDIGHCDTQVTLAAFEQGNMKILSHSFDQNLGGRDFDEVLFNHFAAQFYEKFKIDVKSNDRASARLRASCEKVKKVLSANAEAPLSIECLIGDTDVRGIITREEFEKLSSKLLERVIVPCNKALKYCGLSVDQIHTIELVGSGSRIPAITKYITLFFEKETTRTLNASECVARGCALRCAMFSPSLKVRDYKIEDSFPYSVVIPTPEGEVKLFPKGSSFPNEKILHHVEKNQFYIQVAYRKERDFPAGISHIVGHFGIGSDEPSIAEKVNVDFKVKLNNNGIIELDSATILEDKRSFDLRTLLSGSIMVPSTRMLSLPVTENIDVSTTNEELDVAKENEKMLAEQDIKVEETKDQRNTLESFVYDTRNKLSSSYKTFVTNSEKEIITEKLNETEEWLYDDESEHEQDYTGKLKYLKKLVEPVEIRYEEDAIAKAKKSLQDCIARYRLLADSLRADHKVKVKNVCIKAEQWLMNAVSKRDSSSKTLLTDINGIIKLVESDCESIIRSKSIYSWLEIPMDSDQKDQPVDSEKATKVTKEAKALEKCIVKYRLHAETLSAGMKDKVYNVFMKAEEQFLNAVSQKHSSPKTLAAEIIRITKLVESDCERIIRSKSSSLWHEESNQRYQASDSEIARRKASKALQTCIAEHRLKAESLTPDMKEKVLIECKRAELRLKQSSPDAMATYFTQITEKLKSNCQSIIISNPSFQRHEKSYQREETSDSESGRTEATTAFQTCITDYRLHAMSLTADKKEMVLNKCNGAEVWLYQLSPNTMRTNIIEVLANFKSICQSIITSNPSNPRHEKSNQRNETMDSENDRTNATKTLQICIADYRLHANSLTAEKKERVLNECNGAEVWLYQSSPNAMTTNIIEVIEQLKSNCESIIRFNPSLPRHENSHQRDEIRDFENARTEATKALQTCIAENRLQAESLATDKKETVRYECNRAEAWLTGLFQKQSSPNDITQIIDATKHLESFCKSIIISNPSFPWNEQPKDSDQRGQPMDMEPIAHPVDANQGEQPMYINQIDQPMGSDQGDPHAESQMYKSF